MTFSFFQFAYVFVSDRRNFSFLQENQLHSSINKIHLCKWKLVGEVSAQLILKLKDQESQKQNLIWSHKSIEEQRYLFGYVFKNIYEM